MPATIGLKAFPYSQNLDCPSCHKSITVYDTAGSDYVVCDVCNAYHKLIGTTLLQKQHTVPPIANKPLIAIGSQGTLRDTPYKVLGYMEKKEADTEYQWREYMLYSYTKGYAFLAEYDGHWSFIAGKDHFPEVANAKDDGLAVEIDDTDYAMYNQYSPIITALIGEYDWDVYEERVHTKEFIHPPFLLVQEQDKKSKKIDWYLGEYLEPEEIAKGFNVDPGSFPEKIDIGANQPNPYKKRWVESVWLTIIAAIILIGIQVALMVSRPGSVIMNKSVSLDLMPPPIDTAKHDTTKLDSIKYASTSTNYSAPANGNYEFKPLRTSSFYINGPAPVDVDLYAPVDNNWFEATVELVSDKDNQTWDVSKEIEYYHGYEDGESWSEGSNSESVSLYDIPAGKYHLNFYPYGGTSAIDHVDIKVRANVILWQNILITLLLLCLYPLFCWYMNRRYEVNRWMGNYYSPYTKTND